MHVEKHFSENGCVWLKLLNDSKKKSKLVEIYISLEMHYIILWISKTKLIHFIITNHCSVSSVFSLSLSNIFDYRKIENPISTFSRQFVTHNFIYDRQTFHNTISFMKTTLAEWKFLYFWEYVNAPEISFWNYLLTRDLRTNKYFTFIML